MTSAVYSNKELLEKIKKLADAMYNAAAYLGPVGSGEHLRKAMNEYHEFIIHECKEEPVSEDYPVWLDELDTKLKSMSKEEFQRVMQKYEEECKLKEETAIEGLKKEIEQYCITHGYLDSAEDCGYTFNEQIGDIARHFANWQKQKDNISVSEDLKEVANAESLKWAEGHSFPYRPWLRQCFINGSQWQKQQMMKNAIDGVITFDYYKEDKVYGCVAHDSFCLEDRGLRDCDKVKIIVIKEKDV